MLIFLSVCLFPVISETAEPMFMESSLADSQQEVLKRPL